MVNKSMLKIGQFVILMFICCPFLYAHSGDTDFLRSTGKIYSVVAAVVVIFMAIIAYLWRLDKKLTKLENNLKDEHKTS